MRDLDSMADHPKSIPWKKWALIGAAVFAALVLTSYLVYASLGSGRLNPVTLLALAAAISIAIPMIRSNFFPSARDCAAEFTFHEQRLEEEILRSIGDVLGPEALQGLSTAPDGAPSSSAGELEELLAQEKVRHDAELHFALLVALAGRHATSGDPEAAIPLLQTALDIKPRQFVTRMHLAGHLEWVGGRDDACRHYRWLRNHPEGLSKAMKKLVASKLGACRED